MQVTTYSYMDHAQLASPWIWLPTGVGSSWKQLEVSYNE
jgi:hypothetical protein